MIQMLLLMIIIIIIIISLITIMIMIIIIIIIITIMITTFLNPVSITRFPLRRFSPGAGLLRNRLFHR